MTDPTGTKAAHPMLYVVPPPADAENGADATGTKATHPMLSVLPPPPAER